MPINPNFPEWLLLDRLNRSPASILDLFGIDCLFWEFFTSFNLFGEPISLIALELVFWTIIASTEAIGIAVVYEYNL